MASNEKCSTCKFWNNRMAIRASDSLKVIPPQPGSCCKKAPALSDPRWPVTDGNDYCGEYEAKS